jgi:hypothetical protein
MVYFLLKQDGQITNAPRPLGLWSKINFRDLTPERAHRLDARMSFEIEGNGNTVFPDLIVSPLLLVSQEVKKVISMYEARVTYKPVFYTNLKHKQHQLYFLPILRQIDCLAPQSVLTPGRISAKKLAMDLKHVKDHSFFKIADVHSLLYAMRMDLAESLLIRDMKGFVLEEIELFKGDE